MQVQRLSRLLKAESDSLSRRTTLKVAGAALMASSVAVSVARRIGAAADATPSANESINTELLGVGVPSGHPDLRLQMIRWTLAPGGTTEPHVRPGARVNFVETGIWGVTVIEGPVELQPAGGDRLDDREMLDIGVEYLLEPGDSLFVNEGAAIASRSADAEPLVLWSSAISPAETPTTESIPVGTPAPTPDR